MDKQMTISAFSDELAQVRTKKKEFLSQIERIVPWKEWLAMIQPCYYKGGRGNKPYPLEVMLRLYLLQNLYDLSDEATVAEAIDSRAFSDFCGVDSSNQVPDGDTLGRFRNLLIRNGLQEKLFAQVVAALMERGLILKKGTIVDSAIISAPSSTKNKEKKRDPDAHQVKKGNTWHFGYKAHIGVDKDSSLVLTAKATPADMHDVSEASELLTGEEEVVYGDSGYLGAGNQNDMHEAGLDMVFVQDNQSMSTKGVLRGLHFQKQYPQGKLVRVIKGRVFDVAVDLRSSSKTYGKWYGVELTEENKKQFYISEGFAHGFPVLSDTAEFCYKVTDFYHPGDEGSLAWNDPEIGIQWPELTGSYPGVSYEQNFRRDVNL